MVTISSESRMSWMKCDYEDKSKPAWKTLLHLATSFSNQNTVKTCAYAYMKG